MTVRVIHINQMPLLPWGMDTNRIYKHTQINSDLNTRWFLDSVQKYWNQPTNRSWEREFSKGWRWVVIFRSRWVGRCSVIQRCPPVNAGGRSLCPSDAQHVASDTGRQELVTGLNMKPNVSKSCAVCWQVTRPEGCVIISEGSGILHWDPVWVRVQWLHLCQWCVVLRSGR